MPTQPQSQSQLKLITENYSLYEIIMDLSNAIETRDQDLLPSIVLRFGRQDEITFRTDNINAIERLVNSVKDLIDENNLLNSEISEEEG